MKKVLSMLLVLSNVAFAQLLPFDLNYKASMNQGIALNGTARTVLTQNGNNWLFNFKASMKVASLEHKSSFKYSNGQIVPQKYSFKRETFLKNKTYNIAFQNGSAVVGNNKYTLQGKVLDEANYELALQLDLIAGKKSFSYNVATEKGIEKTAFKVVGYVDIKTPVGVLSTVQVQKVRDADSKRQTNIWFATDYNYILVALEQKEVDGKSYKVELKSGTIDGIEIIGD
jgi:hypothetical protein